jgi:hypothetical protein
MQHAAPSCHCALSQLSSCKRSEMKQERVRLLRCKIRWAIWQLYLHVHHVIQHQRLQQLQIPIGSCVNHVIHTRFLWCHPATTALNCCYPTAPKCSSWALLLKLTISEQKPLTKKQAQFEPFALFSSFCFR